MKFTSCVPWCSPALACLGALFYAPAVVLAQPANQTTLSLRLATPPQSSVPRYGKFELSLDLGAAWDNPFDPDQIDVYGIFTAPDGKAVRVNGFFYQPFSRRLEGGAEKIEPAGEPSWKLRFTPHLTGTWRYQVFAHDRTGRASSPAATLEVTSSASPGFIRRCRENPRVFAYDNGAPFFAVGQNVCWGSGRGSFDYDDWLPALSQAGGNWIRIWMCSWNCALEWSGATSGNGRSGSYAGVGRYNLANAWKLDTILDIAERHGISVMLCFGTYGEFTEGGFFNEGQWKANPYNRANGGPCAKPEDFWTNKQARKLYQRRLRYLLARYGTRTNIHSWEFWNEATASAPWVAEMARFVKGTGEFSGQPTDPYGHLLTTTYGTAEVWSIPEIDFTQTHSYGTANIADHAREAHNDAVQHAVHGKPHLLGEFGIDWRSPDTKYDPDKKGVNLHNALWASALSGNAGGAMIWWWDNYIHPANLYWHFTPLRNFVDTVPWTSGPWMPLLAETTGVNLYALAHGRQAALWAQNPNHHWQNLFEQRPVLPVLGATVTLRGLPLGRYAVEWWNTWKGGIINRETAECTANGLRLRLPKLETDLAARIMPERTAP